MSLTKATYSMIDGQFINAADYGVVGNGVANDTAALNAAYAAAAAAKKALYIPAGDYLFTSQLLWNQNVDVIGQSEFTRLYKQGNFNGILITGAAAGCTFAQFNVWGKPGNGGSGIVIRSASYLTLRNVTSLLHGQDGIYFDNTTATGDPTAGTFRVTLQNVNCSSNGRDGIGLDGTGYVTGVNVCNVCYFETVVCNANGNYGIRQYGNPSAGYHFWTNVTCAENDVVGMYIDGISNYIGVYLESNTTSDLELSSNSIRNNIFVSNENILFKDSGTDNMLSGGAFSGMRVSQIYAPNKPGNVAGRDLVISSAPSISTGAAATGGTLFLYGGDAAGTSGSANGGIVRISGGDGSGGGQKGPVWIQGNGGGVTIGATTTPSASTLVRFESTTKAVQYVGITTTQRNALTPLAGMVIFNISTSKLQVYDGSNWIDLH
jgi:hypothetical protein